MVSGFFCVCGAASTRYLVENNEYNEYIFEDPVYSQGYKNRVVSWLRSSLLIFVEMGGMGHE